MPIPELEHLSLLLRSLSFDSPLLTSLYCIYRLVKPRRDTRSEKMPRNGNVAAININLRHHFLNLFISSDCRLDVVHQHRLRWTAAMMSYRRRRIRTRNPLLRCLFSVDFLFVLVLLFAIPKESSPFSLSAQRHNQDTHRILSKPRFQVEGIQSSQLRVKSPHQTRPWISSRSIPQQTSSFRLASSSSSESPGSDDDEWQAVLSAFKLYKAAYGDLKVPQRFVVPNMAPWPKASWGLKLGKVVSNIRSTGKYLSANEVGEQTATARRQILENLGFLWRVRQESKTAARTSGSSEQIPLPQLYRALSAYKQIVVEKDSNGSEQEQFWSVPVNFYVPDLAPWPETVRGLPLGQQLGNLKRRLAKNKEAKERFQQLGLTILQDKAATGESDQRQNANDIRFQKVYTALKTYKEIYGDLVVPQPFAVPSDNDRWPEDTWGLRLGARVNAIRSQGTFVNNNPERRKLLDDLGFIWTTSKEATGRRGRKAKSAATAEASSPTDDGVGTTQDGGETDAVDDSTESTGSSIDSLFDESFDFGKEFDLSDSRGKTAPTWGLMDGGRELQEAAAAADQAAKAEEDYAPPRSLADSLKEASERAIEVGVIEGLTENKRVIKGKREKDIPWFNDDFGDDFVFDDVVEALTVYKAIYGDFTNLTNNDDFVIPSPKEITGFLDEDTGMFGQFDVDASARAAAAVASFDQQTEFESSEDLIAAEIKRLQEEVGQPVAAIETEPAVKTKEPKEQVDWPEHLAGMGLGSIVARIRDGSLEVKHLPERKEQLDALDFDWGDPMYFIDVPFEKAMCAMYAYYLVRGDMFVYDDFVMPDEDPWPQALAGYELGKAVTRIRELQNFLEAYHPEKVSLLRMIDFVWFPTMALPLDPNETEMNSEMLLLSAMGHPDYAKMIDIPMGLPDKIIADGPFFETDDPKLWWRTWHNWEYVKDYWYQQGRRDNAFALRRMGYPQMADEHEAKYGPGIFTQINETLTEIESGIDGYSVDEKRELLTKLNFYRQEMLGCTDIRTQERYDLLDKFDEHMLSIMKDSNLQLPDADDGDDGNDGFDSDDDGLDEGSPEEDELSSDDDDLVAESFDIDIDDELGFDLQ